LTAIAWGNPLALAEALAARAPNSPRAQYELGRTYIIYSGYDRSSPYTQLAYAPLERAATLPNSSILPEQALIFMNARMHLPVKPAWWHSMIDKLKKHKPTVQDESSLGTLTQCVRTDQCQLSQQYMLQAYLMALSHPAPSARLLAMYSDYAWNVLDDRSLGLSMITSAVKAAPSEPAYRITLIRMLIAMGQKSDAQSALKQLESLNYGGRLDSTLAELRAMPGMQ
jgi:predicted Zn-dependent protease